jgi:hypothetical protein
MPARVSVSTAPRWVDGLTLQSELARSSGRCGARPCHVRDQATCRRCSGAVPGLARQKRNCYRLMRGITGHRQIRHRQLCGPPTHRIARASIPDNTQELHGRIPGRYLRPDFIISNEDRKYLSTHSPLINRCPHHFMWTLNSDPHS